MVIFLHYAIGLDTIFRMDRPEQHTPDYSRKWVHFGVAATAVFMSTLDSSIVNVALPTIAQQFDADVRVVAWVPQAYILTMTALLLVAGRLLDILGDRKQFTLGFVLFTLGSGLCAFALSVNMLIFSRVFQAMGAAVLMSSNQGLIAKSFPPKQRGRILGINATIVSIGLATGPPLGGFLIDALGWRSIFYINIPIGIAAIVYSIKSLQNNPSVQAGHRFDWIGSILIVSGLTSFFLALDMASKEGWTDPLIISLFSASILLLSGFVYNELRVRDPILRMTILKNRYFTQSCIASFLAFVGLMSASILMPFYLQSVLGYTPRQLGFFMMTIPATMFVIAPFSGWLSDHIGTRVPATIGIALLASGLYSLSTLGMNSGTFDIVWRLALTGLGMAVFSSPNTNAILSSVKHQNVGVASGFTALMRTSGFTFGIALAVTLYNFYKGRAASGSMSEAEIMLHAILPVFAAFAILECVNIIVSATRGKRPQHR